MMRDGPGISVQSGNLPEASLQLNGLVGWLGALWAGYRLPLNY